MTLAPFAELEQRIATATSAMLANAYVVLTNGESFGAELTQADEPSFDMVITGAESLIYLSQHALSDGDEITINGRVYQVAGAPRRLNDHFSRADVVMLS